MGKVAVGDMVIRTGQRAGARSLQLYVVHVDADVVVGYSKCSREYHAVAAEAVNERGRYTDQLAKGFTVEAALRGAVAQRRWRQVEAARTAAWAPELAELATNGVVVVRTFVAGLPV